MKFRDIPQGHYFRVWGDQALNYDYPKDCLCRKTDDNSAQEVNGISFLIAAGHDCEYVGGLAHLTMDTKKPPQ